MKRIITSLLFCFFAFSYLTAQNDIQFNAAENWTGYMNVFDLPADGGGYQFGSAWEVPAVQSILDVASNTIALHPNFNTYAENSTDAFWVNQSTLEGNKMMEGLTFVEPGDTFNGSDLTFSGGIVSNTLSSDYTASFFIKALDPMNDYADALGGSKIVEIPASGSFSVSATAAELAPGLLIQYGFSITGVNANPDNEAALGNITIGAVTTSTNDLEVLNNVSISPNPVTDLLSITSTSKIESYDIFSLSGQLILSGNNANTIDVSNMAPGMYLFAAQLEDKREVIKFLKQ